MSAAEEEVGSQTCSPVTTAEIIAQMLVIRDRKREISAEEKDLNEAWDGLEKQLMRRMEEEGSTRVSSKLGTAILTEKIVPQTDDREAFEAWVLATGGLHMLQHRVNTAAFKEMIEAGDEVPGLSPFKKKDISLRSS